MRVRKRKNGELRRGACSEYFLPFDKAAPEPIPQAALFPDARELRLEIGCGKGAFITALAQKNPEVGFLAVERVGDVVLLAAEKAKRLELDNVKFLCCDADYLPRLLPAHCAARLYLNFCDPWPKARHAKRRLTCRDSLSRLSSLLVPRGTVEFKTDNADLFEFSIPEFEAAGFCIRSLTRDLHASEWAEENIMTEYERNFSDKGYKINRLVADLPGETPVSESKFGEN